MKKEMVLTLTLLTFPVGLLHADEPAVEANIPDEPEYQGPPQEEPLVNDLPEVNEDQPLVEPEHVEPMVAQ